MESDHSGCIKLFAVVSKNTSTPLGLHSPRAKITQRLLSAYIVWIISILSHNYKISGSVECLDSAHWSDVFQKPQYPHKKTLTAEIAGITSILSQNHSNTECVECWDSVNCVFVILEPKCPRKVWVYIIPESQYPRECWVLIWV